MNIIKNAPKKAAVLGLILSLWLSLWAPMYIGTASAAPRCLDFDGALDDCAPGINAVGDVPLKEDGCYKPVDSGAFDRPSIIAYEEVPQEECDLAAPQNDDTDEGNNPDGGSGGTNNEPLPASKIKAECDTPLNAVNNSDSSTDNDCRIIAYLRDFINILTALVGIVSAIMLTVWGIQYTVSRDNPQMVAEARRHILMTVLAVGLYFAVYALLQWLVPGGIL